MPPRVSGSSDTRERDIRRAMALARTGVDSTMNRGSISCGRLIADPWMRYRIDGPQRADALHATQAFRGRDQAAPAVGGRERAPRSSLFRTMWCTFQVVTTRKPHTSSRYRLVIGYRQSFPNPRSVTRTPGGAWRRLYSFRLSSPITRFTSFSAKPAAMISRGDWSRSI